MTTTSKINEVGRAVLKNAREYLPLVPDHAAFEELEDVYSVLLGSIDDLASRTMYARRVAKYALAARRRLRSA